MDRKKSVSHRKAKKSLSKLLAATAGTLVVASAAAPQARASTAPPSGSALQQRVEALRANVAAAVAPAPLADESPLQLAWWGNWHNGGWHPYWHNWPNWHNWHNWRNY